MKTKINYTDGEIYDVDATMSNDVRIEDVVISHNGRALLDPPIKMRLQASIQIWHDLGNPNKHHYTRG